MKYLLALVLLAALQQSVYGYDSSEHQINDYRRILLEDDFEAKCDILNHLQWAGLNDPRIFDWVEAYVLEFYQSSFLSRERFALKRLAIRALADSGNEKYRYSLFLVEVEAAGEDIRHDGKLALAQLDKHIEWQKKIRKNDSQFAHKNAIISTYMKMLSTQDPEIQQLAATGIVHDQIKDTELLAIAFQQWQKLQSQRYLTDLQKNTKRWLLKAIDRNTDRYSHRYDRR
jgi:hypothetical protein